jgi:rhodanese-related sulfurtransferase
MKFLITLVGVVIFSASCPSAVFAVGAEESLSDSVFSGWHFNPYCGLYCVYLTVRAAGKRIHFDELVKQKYLSSAKGSSLPDLLKAAEDSGLHAKIVRRLTIKDLRRSPYTIILHVKADLESKQYNHYELFLGKRGNGARIINAPKAVQLVPFNEIAPRWGGDGLVLSPEPINLSIFENPRRLSFILWSIFSVVIVLGIRYCYRWSKESTRIHPRLSIVLSIGQAAGFTITAMLVGMLYHFATDAGLLSNSTATAAIQEAHLGNFVPKVSMRKLERWLKNDTVVVDARLAEDYEKGHINGAISIPVNATEEELQKATKAISGQSRIVLYCQSSRCPFAERVAIKLLKDGFSNVSIFKGGWAEWTANINKDRGL